METKSRQLILDVHNVICDLKFSSRKYGCVYAEAQLLLSKTSRYLKA